MGAEAGEVALAAGEDKDLVTLRRPVQHEVHAFEPPLIGVYQRIVQHKA